MSCLAAALHAGGLKLLWASQSKRLPGREGLYLLNCLQPRAGPPLFRSTAELQLLDSVSPMLQGKGKGKVRLRIRYMSLGSIYSEPRRATVVSAVCPVHFWPELPLCRKHACKTHEGQTA